MNVARSACGVVGVALVLTCASVALSADCLPPDPRPADAITALVADDASPVGTRIPLILVHGYGGTDSITSLDTARAYWQGFLDYFYAHPEFTSTYKIFRLHYLSNQYTVLEIARAFANKIDEKIKSSALPDVPFVMLAHSMGGLVARSYMQQTVHRTGAFCGQNGGDRISKLVTLATPHHGSPAASGESALQLALNADLRDAIYQLLWNLTPPNDWITTIGLGSGVFFGFLSFDKPNRSDLLWDNYDGNMDDRNNDVNVWLQSLNNDLGHNRASYDDKLVAYYGFVDPASPDYKKLVAGVYSADGPHRLLAINIFDARDTLLHASIAMGYGLYNGSSPYPYLMNDGLVPKGSGQFEGHIIHRTVECPGYDHKDMKDSSLLTCDGGLNLFDSLAAELTHQKAALTSPTPGSTLTGASVTFNWSGGSGVIEYWLYVGATAGGFDLYDHSAGTAISATVSGLPSDGRTLYARLWSRFASGWEYADYTYTATTGGPPGPVSGMSAPLDVITTASPSYTWTAAATATQYNLLVRDSGGYTRINEWYLADAKCASGTGICSVTPGTALPNGSYTWWVQTWNGHGYGPWSSGLSFTVSLGPPAAATLVAPTGTITTATPTYTWTAVASSTWYYLWVNDSTGTKIQKWYTAAGAGCPSGTGTCSLTPGNALAAGAGQWWIQTWNSNGYGPWSNGINFTVSLGPPPAATLVSPAGTITTGTPTYAWTAVASSTWYHLWVNNSMGPRVEQWYTAVAASCPSGTGTCSVTPPIALAAGAGQWWVQTWNPTGYGPWSSGFGFTVSP